VAARELAGAGSLLSVCALSHFFTGYIVTISLALLLFVPHPSVGWRRRLWRLGRIGALTGAALAFLVLPLLLTSENVLKTRWGADSKWDSHGWKWVMGRLLNGGLFDGANLPVITLLVALEIGLILVALLGKGDHLQTWILACFVLWVILFFGRASLGSLLDLLPMSGGIHMSRFISGVQIFGLILAGLGLSAVIRWISKLRWVWALAAGALLVGVMSIPVSERITFICQNDFWAISAKQGYDAALGFQGVVQLLEASSQARIHAGFPKTWGDELKIGGVPVYSLLQGRVSTWSAICSWPRCSRRSGSSTWIQEDRNTATSTTHAIC